MRIREGFMLREIAGQWVVVPIGKQTVEYACLPTLSESGALLWERLACSAEMVDLLEAIRSEYAVEEETSHAPFTSRLPYAWRCVRSDPDVSYAIRTGGPWTGSRAELAFGWVQCIE